MQKITRIRIVFISLTILAVLVILIVILGLIKFYKINSLVNSLSEKVLTLENRFSSTTEELRVNIANTHNSLSNALIQERQNVGNIEEKLGAYRQEVGSYSSTVTTLQKLSKTDPELLIKYSKIFFLNENYAPVKLTEIPNQYKYSDSKILKLHAQVWPNLQRMIDDAAKVNTTIYVYSAFRSFNEQQALKGQYSVTYGAGSANQFSADQGYSEHQLGTTVDLITPGLGGVVDGFENTLAYNWLLENAYRYGFILSYPQNNKFYVFEPWHWRFVGIKLATDLHNQKKNFYDLDQRDIDEYLVSIFD